MHTEKTYFSQWLIGGVLAITGALVLSTLLMSSSYAQTNSNIGNLEANVNINDVALSFGGLLAWQHPQGGSESSFSYTGVGDTLTGVVGGFTTVLVNVNVIDPNGYGTTVNVISRLVHTMDNGTNVNDVGRPPYDAMYVNYGSDGYPQDRRVAPAYETSACTNVANIDPSTRTWHCAINMYYMAHPTASGTDVNPSEDYSAEHWRMIFAATKGTSTTTAYDFVHFEYPNILGLKINQPSISFGNARTDGVAILGTSNWLENMGNQYIDIDAETDKATDGTAWSCIGGGNPLVSDMHMHVSDTNYNAMIPLNLNVTGLGSMITNDLPVSGGIGNTIGTNLMSSFATTQAIGPGMCTLSYIVFTAIKGY